MDKKDWEEIVYKCAEDYKAAKSFDGEGIKTPPRDFIRAWMQINYKIFKLSGYFYRLFNRLVIQENRTKTHTDNISESIGEKISTRMDSDTLKRADILMSVEEINGLIKKYGQPTYPKTDGYSWFEFFDYTAFYDVPLKQAMFVEYKGENLAVSSLEWNFRKAQTYVGLKHYGVDGNLFFFDEENGDEIKISIKRFAHLFPQQYLKLLDIISEYDELNESVGERIATVSDEDILQNATITLSHKDVRRILIEHGDLTSDADFEDYELFIDDDIIISKNGKEFAVKGLSLTIIEDNEDEDPQVVVSTFTKMKDGSVKLEDQEDCINIYEFQRKFPRAYQRILFCLEKYDLNESIGERITSHSDGDISDKARISLSYDDIWDIVKKYGIDDFWANIHQYEFYRFYPNTDRGYGCYSKDAIFVDLDKERYYKKLFLKSLRIEEGVGDDVYKTNVEVVLGTYFIDSNGIVQPDEEITTLNIRDFHRDFPNEYNTLLGYLSNLNMNESIGERIEQSSEESDLSRQATRQIEEEIEDGFFTLLRNHFKKHKEGIIARAKANGLGLSFVDETKEETFKLSRGGEMSWESKCLKFFLNYNKNKINKKTNKIDKQFLGMMEFHILNDINHRDVFQFKVLVKEPFSYMSNTFKENWDEFKFVTDLHQRAAFEKFITAPIFSFSASACQPSMRNAHLFIDVIELIVDHFKEINEYLNQFPNKGICQHVKEIFNEVKENYYNDSTDSVYN